MMVECWTEIKMMYWTRPLRLSHVIWKIALYIKKKKNKILVQGNKQSILLEFLSAMRDWHVKC